MKLTDSAVKNAKPNPPKTRKLFDGRGLYLEIIPKGNKGWRLKYRFAGREKLISLGVYPDVSLKYARERREEARELLAKGIDPSEQRKIDKLQNAESNENTFQVVSEAWFNSQKNKWSKSYQVKVTRMLERRLQSSQSFQSSRTSLEADTECRDGFKMLW